MKIFRKLYEIVLMVIDYIIFILLCLFILINCTKINYYVTQIQTSKVYPFTYTRTEIPIGQPLFIKQRRRHKTTQSLRNTN